jgi:hypothetical protein
MPLARSLAFRTSERKEICQQVLCGDTKERFRCMITGCQALYRRSGGMISGATWDVDLQL